MIDVFRVYGTVAGMLIKYIINSSWVFAIPMGLVLIAIISDSGF